MEKLKKKVRYKQIGNCVRHGKVFFHVCHKLYNVNKQVKIFGTHWSIMKSFVMEYLHTRNYENTEDITIKHKGYHNKTQRISQ